jgi:nucleotide-binding universal stress UspA family protein
MSLDHIVVAADESEASRQAIRCALRWSERARGRVTVLTVSTGRPAPTLATGNGAGRREGSLVAIEHWLAHDLEGRGSWGTPALAEAWGVPSIEISRFAESAGAGLLVLGRKPRSPTSRLLLGDTADAVARRSSVPCLFVSAEVQAPDELLVALDGTRRGEAVLDAARSIARTLGAALRFVTVEPQRHDELDPPAAKLPTARTTSLIEQLAGEAGALRVRRGTVVEEIIEEVELTSAPVLVIGYHRGGPPAVLEAGSAARQLVHRAPCAVLTIPL